MRSGQMCCLMMLLVLVTSSKMGLCCCTAGAGTSAVADAAHKVLRRFRGRAAAGPLEQKLLCQRNAPQLVRAPRLSGINTPVSVTPLPSTSCPTDARSPPLVNLGKLPRNDTGLQEKPRATVTWLDAGPS